MNLTEMEKYVHSTLNHLQSRLYTELGPLSGVRMCAIGYGERRRVLEDMAAWTPFGTDETWGGPDAHFCFGVNYTLPEAARGRLVVAELETGASDIWNTDNPQFLAYVDGKLRCALDMNHREVVLTEKAEPGTVVSLRLYGYSNTAGKSNFLHLRARIPDPLAQAAYYDLKAPFETACRLRDDDDRRTRLLQSLCRAADLLDLRNIGPEAWADSLHRVRELLAAEVLGRPDPDAPQVYSVGHTHIDVAWKWPVRQTREKALRSFSTVLSLMEEYPEYKFMSSQPQLYAFVKEDCPEVFAQIRRRVAEGRWETEGAMWLEADCNLSSGESLIRQIAFGKRFFEQEFGTGDNVVLWLPDVFGYSAALPQIMRKTGLRYFMTTKIAWNERNLFPYDTMYWEGIDGSQVLSHFITTADADPYPELRRKPMGTTYNGLENPRHIMGCWQRYQQKPCSHKVLTVYGYGDGGGGSTREMIEMGRRMEQGIPGCPVVRFSGVREFFEDLEQEVQGKDLPKWSGELYLEFHRGTYTSQAANKRDNRRCEEDLAATEWLAQTAHLCCDTPYPADRLHDAWKLVLLNQFHDILPGSSIAEVYEQTAREYTFVKAECASMQAQALDALGRRAGCEPAEPDCADTLLAWNPLSYPQDLLLTLPADAPRPADAPCQRTADGSALCLVEDLPPLGHKAVALTRQELPRRPLPRAEYLPDGALLVRTGRYRAQIQPDGRLNSLYDEQAQRELFAPDAPGNHLRVYDDRPYEFDAWNIDEAYVRKHWDPEACGPAELLEAGPLRWVVRTRLRYLNSTIEQKILFYAHSPRIDFETTVDWQEHQQLLKVHFPFAFFTRKLQCEIQYGSVERPTHTNTSWEQARFEMCMHRWLDLSDGGYGAALLNDSKYGYSARDSQVALTLIKAGVFPAPDADIGTHHFTYSLMPHTGDFRTGGVVREAGRLNRPALTWLGKRESESAGLWPEVHIDRENVFCEVFKHAESQDATILRMYEAAGMQTRVHWNLAGAPDLEVWECDLLEHRQSPVPTEKGLVTADFGPYEIKTFAVVPRSQPAKQEVSHV